MSHERSDGAETRVANRNGPRRARRRLAEGLRLPDSFGAGRKREPLVENAVRIIVSIIVALSVIGTGAAAISEIRVTVRTTGVIRPARMWSLRAPEEGEINSVLVSPGQHVEQGDLLAVLQVAGLREQLTELEREHQSRLIAVRRAEAALPLERHRGAELTTQAAAQRIKARAELRRQLVEHGFDADTEVLEGGYRVGTHYAIDLALAEVMSAEAHVRLQETEQEMTALGAMDIERARAEAARVKARVIAMRRRLLRLGLHSPGAGVVLTERLDELPGTSVQRGSMVLQIGSPKRWEAALWVPEEDVQRVGAGDSVHMEIRAYAAARAAEVTGVVKSVATEGTPAQDPSPVAPRSYRILVALHDSVDTDSLRSGYLVDARIVTAAEPFLQWLRRRFLRRPGA